MNRVPLAKKGKHTHMRTQPGEVEIIKKHRFRFTIGIGGLQARLEDQCNQSSPAEAIGILKRAFLAEIRRLGSWRTLRLRLLTYFGPSAEKRTPGAGR